MPDLMTPSMLLSKHHSEACMQIIKLWALQHPEEANHAQILLLLDQLARLMQVPEKMEPGTRGVGVGPIQKQNTEKLEPGTRGVLGGSILKQNTEKLEPGTRSAPSR